MLILPFLWYVFVQYWIFVLSEWNRTEYKTMIIWLKILVHVCKENNARLSYRSPAYSFFIQIQPENDQLEDSFPVLK